MSISESTVWYSLLSIFIGVFIYSWDLPKTFRRLLIGLPTNVISNRHPSLDMTTIENSYFRFYDSLEGDFKAKIEKHSGFFHLSVNIFAVSIALLIINCICFRTDWDNLYIIIIILIISLISLLLLYKRRLMNSYARTLEDYYNSDIYHQLETLENSN